MSDTLIELKLKSKTGQIIDLQVLEILSVNGKPFQSADEQQALRDHVIHLDGRVSVLEKLLVRGESDG